MDDRNWEMVTFRWWWSLGKGLGSWGLTQRYKDAKDGRWEGLGARLDAPSPCGRLWRDVPAIWSNGPVWGAHAKRPRRKGWMSETVSGLRETAGLETRRSCLNIE